MARYEQTISLNGMNTETSLALAFEAMKQLQWEVLLAGPNTLIGHTPKSWKSKGQQINCSVDHYSLTAISETPSELPNLGNVHKNNTILFLETFEALKTSVDEQSLSANMSAIADLRNVTQHAIAKKQEEYRELDKAMNLSGSNLFATYTIIGINVLVFLLMAIDGAGLIVPEPNGLVHLRWGSNFAPLTLSGDWWRLMTNVFIHFGAIHIAMNMYCLYSIATYLEPLLGKQKYVTAYLCTGVIASLTSLWWHNDPSNSAGASGAIFGMYGLFLAFLTTAIIPASVRKSLLRSIGIFVVFNLAYGMKSGVDNAAHVGGLVSGFIIGYAYVFAIKKEKEQEQNTGWLLPVIIAITVGIAGGYLRQHVVHTNTRASLMKELKESSYEDFDKFNLRLKEFDQLHQAALVVMQGTSLAGNDRLDKMNYVVLPKWNQAAQMMESTNSYNISSAAHLKAKRIGAYINIRKKETELLKQQATEKQANNDLEMQIKEYRAKAESLFADIAKH